MARGRLITIEGLDGAGKTTLAEGLVRELGARMGYTAPASSDAPPAPGDATPSPSPSPSPSPFPPSVATDPPPRLLREPGGVELSERIRELVKDPALTVGARAEALLYAAARAQLVEELLTPLLAQGGVVVLDRFVDSSLAYQGAARGLGIEAVGAINALATGGLSPDRTLLLRVSPRTGRERQGERGRAPDRMEREGNDFFAAIANAYDELARAEPARIRTIDAEQAPREVLAEALAAVEDLF